jgi:hypothetical protein
MKQGTPNHPKMKALARALKVPVPMAVGIMELLWHFTRDYAEAGDIGRHTDAAIAEAAGWPSDRESRELIDALVQERWIDCHERHRLVVHDWPEHADDYAHRKLALAGRYFYDGSKPHINKLTKEQRETAARRYSSATNPPQIRPVAVLEPPSGSTQTKPNHAKPIAHVPDGEPTTDEVSDVFERIYARHPKKNYKIDAEREFSDAVLESSNRSGLLNSIEQAHKVQCELHAINWRKDGGRFAPKLSDWIRQKCWLDEMPDSEPSEPVHSGAWKDPLAGLGIY